MEVEGGHREDLPLECSGADPEVEGGLVHEAFALYQRVGMQVGETVEDLARGHGLAGECKSWTLDSGLDHGLDYGLKYGLNSRLIFKLLAMVASQDLD